jgi:hypothetical protein
MSDYHYVFVGPLEPTPVRRLADELGQALGLRFLERPSDYADFLATTEGAALDLGTHPYENDREMPFQDHPFVITVRRVGQPREAQEARARTVFDQLAATRRHRLLLVDDLQRPMGSFEPGSGRADPGTSAPPPR